MRPPGSPRAGAGVFQSSHLAPIPFVIVAQEVQQAVQSQHRYSVVTACPSARA
jgi:hypothetical protein